MIEKLSTYPFQIVWEKPSLEDEIEEYTGNESTQKFLQEVASLRFFSDKEVLQFLEEGSLKKVLPPYERILNLDPLDFFEQKSLSDKAYAKSYNLMLRTVQEKRIVKMPAPILIFTFGVSYLFSGNRRFNLARKLNLPIKCWVVNG